MLYFFWQKYPLDRLPAQSDYCRSFFFDFFIFQFLPPQYPLELLPPQSDFQGKKFLRKNFHPFSGAHYPHRSSPLKESTERVKIFPQKFFAQKVGLGREELQGIHWTVELRPKRWNFIPSSNATGRCAFLKKIEIDRFFLAKFERADE